MFRRPLTLTACLIAAGLVALILFLPSFPLENRTTNGLSRIAEARESAEASGCVRSITPLGSGDFMIMLSPASVTGSGCGTLRVRRLAVCLSESRLKSHLETGLAGDGDKNSAVSYSIRFAGRNMAVSGHLTAVRHPTNPGQFDSFLYERLKGCPFRLTESRITSLSAKRAGVRGQLAYLSAWGRLRIETMYPGSAAGFFSALLIGDRTLMSDSEKQMWRKSGVAHILAISGLHLTLIGMGLFGLLRKLRLPLRAVAVVTICVMSLYALVTGLSLSALRALIMLIYSLGAKMCGRCADRYNAVSLAALLILAEDPAYLMDAGFQLSFSAAAVIALFAGRGKIKMAFLLFLIPLPVVVWHYCELPLFSLLFNLVLVPLVPALLLIGFFGMIFGGPLVWIGSGLVYLMESVFGSVSRWMPLTFISGRPFLWQCLLYEGLLAAGLCLAAKAHYRKRRYLLVLVIPLLVLILKRPVSREFSLTMLDVGQGDSFIVQTPDGNVCLVDSGSSSIRQPGKQRLMPYLMYQGYRIIDYVFVTHSDEDHINGVRELLEAVARRETSLRVKTLVLPYRSAEDGFGDLKALARQADIRILIMRKGDKITYKTERKSLAQRKGFETSIESLGPGPAVSSRDENAASLILKISCGCFDALMTGDTVDEGEQDLLNMLKKNEDTPSFECLKVAHHGSRYSTPEAFLECVQPQIGLISCGYRNVYGHPHRELLERLKAAGTAVFRTDRHGAVTVRSDGVRWSVSAYRS